MSEQEKKKNKESMICLTLKPNQTKVSLSTVYKAKKNFFFTEKELFNERKAF